MRPVIFAADSPSFKLVEDQPIVSTGTYALAANYPPGETSTFTADDLADAVAASQDPTLRMPRLKLGHSIDWADGEPAFGKATNLRLSDDGQTIIADYGDVPKWLADIMPSAYPNRSIEASFGVEAPSGRTYRMVITAVSLLGVQLPGVSSLEDLGTLYGAEEPDGVEVEAAQKVMASANIGEHSDATDGDSNILAVATEDVKRDYYESLGPDQQWWWVREMYIDPDYLIVDDDSGHLLQVGYTVSGDSITFDEPKEVVTEYRPVAAGSGIRKGGSAVQAFASRSESRPQPEGDDVDLTRLRERLGLSADTPDEDVIKAAAEAVPADGSGDGDGSDETAGDEAGTETDDGEGDESKPDEEEEEDAKPDSQASTIQVDRETFAALQRNAQAGATAREQQINAERDRILTAAVKDGRIPPSRKEHYRKMFASDPDGTKTLLTAEVEAGGLAKNAIPVSEDGEVPATDAQAAATYDESWLSPAERARARGESGSDNRVIQEVS